jgi:hypothetical protein
MHLRRKILHRITIPPGIILHESETIARRGKVMIEAGTAEATGVVIADAADGAGVGAGGAAEAEVAVAAVAIATGVHMADTAAAGAICLHRNTLHRKVGARIAAYTTIVVRATIVPQAAHPRKRGKTTLFCRVNHWRNTGRVRCLWLLWSRWAITNPKSGNRITSRFLRGLQLACSPERELPGGFLEACRTGC